MTANPQPSREYPAHRAAAQDASFERFLAAFPERVGGHDVDAAREAFENAKRRASTATIITGAEAYARATEGRPARFVMSARRWLNESRWRDAAPVSGPSLIWISYGSPEWTAWRRHYVETRNKSPPLDRRGGWRFPSRWPPEHPQQFDEHSTRTPK